MSDDKLNLVLRTEILKRALVLENEVNQLLFNFLGIKKEITKTLSNKSSSLSYKNKIDLLLDLGRIDNQEYQLFLLFMEIRNQFLHNSSAKSFLIVLEDLGKDRTNKLLNFREDAQTDDLEYIYKSSFYRLFIHLLELVKSKYNSVVQSLENIAKAKMLGIDKQYENIDDALDSLDMIIEHFKIELFPSEADSEELKNFKTTLLNRINIIITNSSEGKK